MKTSRNSLKKGFIHLPVIIIILFLVVAFTSVNVLGFRDQKRGRPFNYLREYCKDKPALNICTQLTRQTPKPSPSPTPVPSPTASTIPTNSPSPSPAESKTKVYWLIPTNQNPASGFESGLPALIETTRQFFAAQLNGKTFHVSGSIQKINSSHEAPWFYGCDSDQCGYSDRDWRINHEGYIWDRVKSDLASNGISVDSADSLTIVILSPGTYTFGTGSGFGLGDPKNWGMATLGEQKTAGSLGLNSPEPWCQPVQDQSCINQVTGSFIHEVGHALGLPHPEDPKDQDVSIMWSWWKYPNIGLSEKEKAQLSNNPAIRK